MPVVAIDPGHGGPDPGRVGPTGLKEADVNWDVCLKAKQYLERLGVEVIMTRDEKENPPQVTRASRAANANVLVSVHCNGVDDPRAYGMEALIYPERYDSGALALLLLGHLDVTTRRADRGIKQRPDLTLLQQAKPPTVLVELAFISNPDEEALLRADWYREKAALGITYALRDFLNLIHE